MTKYGRPALRRSRIEHFGDVRMVHHRQRLPLGLEAGDHLPRVHARLDDLERDRPLDRLGLLGHEHDAHAAFADLLQQLVRPDDRAGPLGDRPVDGSAGFVDISSVQETIFSLVGPQKELYALPQCNVSTARVVEKLVPLLGRVVFAPLM